MAKPFSAPRTASQSTPPRSTVLTVQSTPPPTTALPAQSNPSPNTTPTVQNTVPPLTTPPLQNTPSPRRTSPVQNTLPPRTTPAVENTPTPLTNPVQSTTDVIDQPLGSIETVITEPEALNVVGEQYPYKNLASQRLAGRKISVRVKSAKVKDIEPKELLTRILGRWDPVAKRYTKFELMMDFMEAGIALGYPIRGVNITTISQGIGEELIPVLGDKPSNEIVLAIILSLFRVKDHVKEVLKNSNPGTGGGSPDAPMEKLEEFYNRLCEFVHKNEEHEVKKQAAVAAKKQLDDGDVEAAQIIGGRARNSTTRKLFPVNSSTTSTHSRSSTPTSTTSVDKQEPSAFENMCVSIAESKRERLESIKNMSDSYVEKTKIETDILRNQQKNSLIQNLSKKIECLQKLVSQFEGQPLQMKYQEKLDKLVDKLMEE